jgi:hypothetical protein
MKRLPLAAVLAAFFIFLVMSVSVRQAVLMLVGVGMGAALAGARFGFTTGWRQLIEHKDPQGVAGQVLLLALASLAALPLLGQFSELHAALGPPSVSLLVGAFVFGLTMQIADGCGSGTLYKAGLGVPLNMGDPAAVRAGQLPGFGAPRPLAGAGPDGTGGLSATLGTGGALAPDLLLLLALAGVRAWVGPGRQWFARRWDGAPWRWRCWPPEPAAGRPALGRGLRFRAVGGQGVGGPGPVRPRRPTRSGASRATPSASPRPC